MKRILFLFAILIPSVFYLNSANAQQTVLEKISLGTAYIPIGFDNINRSEITVEGIFTDTCYRVGPPDIKINGYTITITQETYHYIGFCGDMLVPYSSVIKLGILKAGNYTIVDGASGVTMGTLPVIQAPPKSPVTYPDDFLYAPVSDASLLVHNGQRRLVISGVFTDECTHFTEIRAQTFGKVIQVLPITERSAIVCKKMSHPFQVTKSVTVPNGHYLLYVRSLSGNSISKMVDVY